jgi:Fe2+ or Zn2+ uptake regulation protein
MEGEKSSATRGSRQREVILEELRKLKTHPRSDELYLLARRRLPRLSLGTVYRNLDRLQREGQVLEIPCGDFARYDGNVLPHDHLMCRRCRRVWDLDSGTVHRPGVVTPLPSGFQIEGSYTIYQGLCPDCRGQATD